MTQHTEPRMVRTGRLLPVDLDAVLHEDGLTMRERRAWINAIRIAEGDSPIEFSMFTYEMRPETPEEAIERERQEAETAHWHRVADGLIGRLADACGVA